MAKKYYVVFEGKAPGVYHSWPECKQQVSGVSGNSYKGYETLDEANEAFRIWNENFNKPFGKYEKSADYEKRPICVDSSTQVNEVGKDVMHAFCMGVLMGSLMSSTSSSSSYDPECCPNDESSFINAKKV